MQRVDEPLHRTQAPVPGEMPEVNPSQIPSDYDPIAMAAPFYQMIRNLLDCSKNTESHVLAARLKGTDLDTVDLNNLATWLADTAVVLGQGVETFPTLSNRHPSTPAASLPTSEQLAAQFDRG